MKHFLILLFIFMINCKNKSSKEQATTTLITKDYELIKAKNSKGLLILFPGGGTTSKETKENFKIVKKATEKGISILLMNFNRHFWIEDEESQELSKLIIKTVKENGLEIKNTFIGGMSIGGNVALGFSNYLVKTNSGLKPKGVFVVDAPIDLYAIYESSQKDVLRKDFSEERLGEPKFIINYFEEKFKSKDSILTKFQEVSPITLKTENTTNIGFLKNKKIRFYTEPDTLWIKSNRQTDFESTNAFTLQKTIKVLKNKNWKNVELIQTKNKGYQINGERNPHSWSIVAVDNLISWVLQ